MPEETKFKELKDIMTVSPITVDAELPLVDAAIMLTNYGFTGLPVVNASRKLIGVFTERNVLSDRSYVNLITLLELFSNLKFYKKDSSPMKGKLGKLFALKVRDVMDNKPSVIDVSDSIEKAAKLLSDPTNNPLPVVDKDMNLKGIISLSDLTKVYGLVGKKIMNNKVIDKQVQELLQTFGKEFVVVTKARASSWFITSVLFAVVGFAIAMFFVIRLAP